MARQRTTSAPSAKPPAQTLIAQAEKQRAAVADANTAQDAAHARLKRLYSVAQPLKSYLGCYSTFDAEHAAGLVIAFACVLHADDWWDATEAACVGDGQRLYALSVLRAADGRGRKELIKLLADGEKVGLVGLWLADGLYRELLGITPVPRPEGPEPLPAPPQSTGAGPASVSNKAARHSIDYRSVHWYGDDYTFTKNQAAIVRLLWDAWENHTPEVGMDTLLSEADCETKRLDHLFDMGKHPAWGAMIRPGSRQGCYRLSPPQGE